MGVPMIGPTGDVLDVPDSDVELYATRGYRVEGAEQTAARHEAALLEEEYGGAEGTLRAGLAGVGSGLSLGLVDLLPTDPTLEQQIRVNPTAHAVGQVAGAAAPALLSGGASAAATGARGTLARGLARTPAGLAEGLGKRAGAALGGGVKGAVARGAVEGALHGAGTGISELARSDDPLTLERVASTLSSGALLGGVAGAGAGVFAKAAEKGLARAARAVEARAKAPTTGSQVVDDLAAYSKAREGAFLIAKGEPKAVLAKQARRVRDALDAPETLAKSPRRLAAALEKETKVLRELVEEGQEETLARLAESDRRVAAAVRERLAAAKPDAKTVRLDKKLASEYRDVAGIGGRGAITLPVEKAQTFVQALDTGELAAARQTAIEGLPGLLEQNLALRSAIDAAGEATGGLLSQAQGLAAGYAIPAITGLLPGGVVGAAGAMVAPKILRHLDGLVTQRLSKAGANVAERTTSAVARALDAASDAAKRARPAATVPAAKVLSSASFAPALKASEKRQYAPADKLTETYREREQELLSQVQAGPTPGSYMMRPEARQAVAARLTGVRAIAPQLADRIESQMARRVEYLAGKLPKRPDVAAISVGPDRWRPSDAQIRQFAQAVQAVEDPASVAERIASGRVTRADVEALREVYPEQLRDLQRQIVEQLPRLRRSLPYETRLALSIVTGVPVVPATSPRILSVLQAQYATEPGTDGGTHAPRAQPQFGSVRKSLDAPTPAQSRQTPRELG